MIITQEPHVKEESNPCGCGVLVVVGQETRRCSSRTRVLSGVPDLLEAGV